MRLFFVFIVLLFSSLLSSFAQKQALTIAEKSGFTATSTYSDVMSFIDNLVSMSSDIRIETLGKSTEGRDIPLLVIANPMPDGPDDLVNDERMVVYFQANIHAGEVEGKEASLMLARDLLIEKDPEIFKHVVLLICPNFNPDGNEKISTGNRTRQNGPVNGVGVRHNGQFLDLNRDAMKVETPEVQGLYKNVLNQWDPYITVDCHTTNGSYHEEPVTFTWMQNPNSDRNLINYMRDKMMPEISENLRSEYKTENCFYGVFLDRTNFEKGWTSYASEPRYIVNYIGLRNRLSILNENYSYADYKSRVLGCYNLLHTILDFAITHKKEIKQLIAQAEENTIKMGLNPAISDSFAIEYKGQATPEKVTIKAIEVDEYVDEEGRMRFKQSDRKKTVTVPYIADYYPSKQVKYPFGYIFNLNDPKIVDVLQTHGIGVESLKAPITLEVECFNFEELKPSERINQGHYTNVVLGEFVAETKEFPEGSILVRTAQPLGRLVACLLEPQAQDGLLKWNYFDRYLVPQWGRNYYPYPVYKILNKATIESVFFN